MLSDKEIEHIRNLATIFAQKWTMGIMNTLMMNGEKGMGFNEIMKNLNGISAAVLSSRLKNLQRMGYVKREVQPGPPTRTRYALSERGRRIFEVADFVLQSK
ncbi:MAG: helix-turn-helix domain-containing protein [Candidatus Micrarchaeia archaeon]